MTFSFKLLIKVRHSKIVLLYYMDRFPRTYHIETVCLLTHSWRKRAEKAWFTGVSVTGSRACSVCFYVWGNWSGAVAWLRFYYFRKRVNDFTIWGWSRLWVYWWRERKRRQRSDAFNAMLNGIKNICGNILTDIKWSWSVIQAKGGCGRWALCWRNFRFRNQL